TTITLRFKNPGKVLLYATVAGCNIADSLWVNIKARSQIVTIGNDTTLCTDATDSLFTQIPYQKYLWQDGSTDSFFVVKQAGVYSLTATDRCNNVSSASIKVSYDTSSLKATGNMELCKLQDTILSANSGFTNYEWSPASAISGSPFSQTIQIRPDSTREYIVNAVSVYGCLLRDTVNVVVENCLNKIIMPTAFTPNDDGVNDIIKPKIFGALKKYEFSIYNRWGQLIFHTTNPDSGWNGKFNGASQNTGAFVWMCRYRFTGDNEKMQKGNFVLIK
ncbi:MAG: gliding motility-associated C-terminal domain-containing protein, partial [Bacteroidetes bacterium]|nr:gliding motility-associated C-terminal domain-containing protein [Bacteroidota bacterium]